MSSEIQVYQHPTFGSIRMFEEDGSALFVASDVAKALGYREAKDMTRYLRETEKGRRNAPTPGGEQASTVITEAGFYHALNMRRTAAMQDDDARGRVEAFQDWVNGEVLPSIRRNGAYVNPSGAESDEELFARALVAASETLARIRAERNAIATENEAMRPMAALGEAVSASSDCIDVRDLGHLLCQNGLKGMGLDNTFKLLREDHYVFKNADDKNVPYQKWINQGLFEVQEKPWTAPDGTVRVSVKTMVTQKGVDYFLRRYAPNRALPGLEIETESDSKEES